MNNHCLTKVIISI